MCADASGFWCTLEVSCEAVRSWSAFEKSTFQRIQREREKQTTVQDRKTGDIEKVLDKKEGC